MLFSIDYEALAFKMANKAINQVELMRHADISQSVIKQIQQGEPIKPKTLGKLARALDCAPADIAKPISPLKQAARAINGKRRRQSHSTLQAAADALADR